MLEYENCGNISEGMLYVFGCGLISPVHFFSKWSWIRIKAENSPQGEKLEKKNVWVKYVAKLSKLICVISYACTYVNTLYTQPYTIHVHVHVHFKSVCRALCHAPTIANGRWMEGYSRLLEHWAFVRLGQAPLKHLYLTDGREYWIQNEMLVLGAWSVMCTSTCAYRLKLQQFSDPTFYYCMLSCFIPSFFYM